GRLLIACVLGCAVFGLIAWHYGLIAPGDAPAHHSANDPKVTRTKDLGKNLYPPVALPPATTMLPERKVDPVVVLGNVGVFVRPDIAAKIPGQVMFIGEEIPEGAAQVAGAAAFIAEPFNFTR